MEAITKVCGEIALNLIHDTFASSRTEENVFLSSVSLMFGLSLVLLGTAAPYKEELVQRFQKNIDNESYHEVVSAVMSKINIMEFGGVTKVLNHVFFQNDVKMVSQFSEDVKKLYSSGVTAVDFKSAAAQQAINVWAKDATDGNIPELLVSPPSNITVLCVINALASIRGWKHPFESEQTQTEDFFLTENESVQCNMMKIITSTESEIKFGYDRKLNCQLLLLPFDGGEICLLIAMPNELSRIKEIEKALTTAMLRSDVDGLKVVPSGVHIHLPKGKLETQSELSDFFQNLGIKSIFNPETAVFKGIVDVESGANMVVSTVLNKSFLEINEAGLELMITTHFMFEIDNGSRKSKKAAAKSKEKGESRTKEEAGEKENQKTKTKAEGAVKNSELVHGADTDSPPRFVMDRPFLFLVLRCVTYTPIFFGRFSRPCTEYEVKHNYTARTSRRPSELPKKKCCKVL